MAKKTAKTSKSKKKTHAAVKKKSTPKKTGIAQPAVDVASDTLSVQPQSSEAVPSIPSVTVTPEVAPQEPTAPGEPVVSHLPVPGSPVPAEPIQPEKESGESPQPVSSQRSDVESLQETAKLPVEPPVNQEQKTQEAVLPQNEALQETTHEETPKQNGSGKKKTLLIILAFVVVLAALAAILLFYRQQFVKSLTKQPAEAPVVQKPSPAPTKPPVEAVDVTLYTLEIQNGSGIPGEASRVKDLLEKEGFQIAQTGNADKYTYTQTTLTAKKGVTEGFLKKLKEVLKQTHDISDEVASSSVSLNSDVLIIVGSKKTP